MKVIVKGKDKRFVLNKKDKLFSLKFAIACWAISKPFKVGIKKSKDSKIKKVIPTTLDVNFKIELDYVDVLMKSYTKFLTEIKKINLRKVLALVRKLFVDNDTIINNANNLYAFVDKCDLILQNIAEAFTEYIQFKENLAERHNISKEDLDDIFEEFDIKFIDDENFTKNFLINFGGLKK